MDIGSLVAPKAGQALLFCGTGFYDRGVVASLDPFVVISEEGDMCWEMLEDPEQFEAVGTASAQVASDVLARIARNGSVSRRMSPGAIEALRELANEQAPINPPQS